MSFLTLTQEILLFLGGLALMMRLRSQIVLTQL